MRRKAFTLNEMMVVIVVIGILSAIGAGVGFAVVRHMKIQSYQNNMRAIEAAQKSNELNRGFFLDADGMKNREPSMRYSSSQAEEGVFSVSVASDGNSVGIATLDSEGKCLVMKVERGQAATQTGIINGACTGLGALETTGESW